jgi:hypothetical protein
MQQHVSLGKTNVVYALIGVILTHTNKQTKAMRCQVNQIYHLLCLLPFYHHQYQDINTCTPAVNKTKYQTLH